MTSPMAQDSDSQSQLSTNLSSAPATAIFDQTDADLGDFGPQAEATQADDCQEALQAPRRRHSHTLFIENRINCKRSVTWFWDHGTEFECQTLNKRQKKDIYWVCKHCTTFKPLHRGNTNNINTHLEATHQILQDKPVPKALTVLELQRHAPSQSHRPELSDMDNRQLSRIKFDAALVAWVTCNHKKDDDGLLSETATDGDRLAYS
jgi:hypothetical protein